MRIVRAALIVVLVLCVGTGVSGAAIEWTELSARATPTTGSSGEATVVFTVELEYSERPMTADLSFGWTVEEIGSGEPTVLHTFYRSTTLAGGALKVALASARVPIAPGGRYRAHVIVDDAANDLHFERDINYTAPLSLPVGIHLRGANGNEEWDLSGVPDEELEEMATAYDALRSDYREVATEVTLEAFFDEHAGSSDAFPATVYLIPALGAENPFGPPDSPVTFQIVPTLYVFPVPDASSVSGLLEQVAVYEREFIGRAFSGGPEDVLFGALSVFVDETAWSVLAAAKAEESRRAAD